MRTNYDLHSDMEASEASSESYYLCKRPLASRRSRRSRNYQESFSSAANVNLTSTQNYLADTSHKCRPGWTEESGRWIFGSVLDPRTKHIQSWNRIFLITCVMAASIDPLFLYTFAMHMELACVYANKTFALTVTAVRGFIDIMYIFHMYLQVKLAYVSKESLVLGTGLLVWDARQIAKNYVCSTWAFTFDVLVLLPIPQVLFWIVVPTIIERGLSVSSMLYIVLAVFLFQYIPRVLHIVVLVKRMQHVTGYVFGSAWWGFALNLIAYFVAAHIAGAIWYLLAVNEVGQCIMARCKLMEACQSEYFGCPRPLSSGNQPLFLNLKRHAFASDDYLQSTCLRAGGRYDFGIFHQAVPLLGETKWFNKILYPLFWGLMTLSSFGNALVPGNEPLELIFSIVLITCGLLLFMLLIGNIQKGDDAATDPGHGMVDEATAASDAFAAASAALRAAALGGDAGVDESSMVADLPEGLRRDIKRHLCLDLVRQVPLFEHMDDLVLDNVCERLTAHLFIKGEMVLREGDPVMKMLFLVRGHFQSSYQLKDNLSSCSLLGPGNFCGDELLSWCLRRTPVDRLPPSTATLIALDSAEVFALEANDLKFVVQHFRHKFEDEKLNRTLRFYSSGWRMWAAVTIQLAWRRCKAKRRAKDGDSLPSAHFCSVPSAYINMADSEAAMRNNRLRFFTAMIASPKPSTHVE